MGKTIHPAPKKLKTKQNTQKKNPTKPTQEATEKPPTNQTKTHKQSTQIQTYF